MTRRALIVIGAGGHARSVADVALSGGFNVRFFVDDTHYGGTMFGVPIVSMEMANDCGWSDPVVVAIGDNAKREKVRGELTSERGSIEFPALFHPSAVKSRFSAIGEGTVVMAGAIIGPYCAVGRFCIVNTNALMDHDCRLADFSSLAPGSTLGGSVSLGERAAIAIGAVVKHGVTIGADTIVGANSYVHSSLDDRIIAYGSPATVIRTREVGDPYLT